MSEQDRLRWRCRRGMLELDLLLQDFLDRGLASLTPDESRAFERLLDYPDNVLLEILMGRMAPAEEGLARVANRIRGAAAHHA